MVPVSLMLKGWHHFHVEPSTQIWRLWKETERYKHHLSHLMTRLRSTFSLGICPVFAVRMKKAWVLSYPLSAQRRLWSDWADAQADLSLRWSHSHFVGFVMRRLICINLYCRQLQAGSHPLKQFSSVQDFLPFYEQQMSIFYLSLSQITKLWACVTKTYKIYSKNCPGVLRLT